MSTSIVDSIQPITEGVAYKVAEDIIEIGPRDEKYFYPLQIDICLLDMYRAFRKYQFLFDPVGGHMLLFNIEGRLLSPYDRAISEGVDPEKDKQEFPARVEKLSNEEIELFRNARIALGCIASYISEEDNWEMWEGDDVDQDGNPIITTRFDLTVPAGDDQGRVGISAVLCARAASSEELMGIKAAFDKMLERKAK